MYETIEKLLKQRGLTIYRLSKITGIAESTLGAWKRRGNYLNFTDLCKVADELNISLDEFRKEWKHDTNVTT